ncbi:hypothetical protein WISP_01035 [Willisornis vidua]|uniref:Uncharacterized protein n=1 Tax=Willisornis vidua TaxID=1566151 RepID=A0ABQ9DVJ0_9PASS|nr:hypothetical protein WISP_01035 [Willisornis vidua]
MGHGNGKAWENLIAHHGTFGSSGCAPVAPPRGRSSLSDPTGGSDGSIKDPDGDTTDPGGSIKDPDGSTADPDGDTTDPGGSIKDLDGSTTDPDGSIRS